MCLGLDKMLCAVCLCSALLLAGARFSLFRSTDLHVDRVLRPSELVRAFMSAHMHMRVHVVRGICVCMCACVRVCSGHLLFGVCLEKVSKERMPTLPHL